MKYYVECNELAIEVGNFSQIQRNLQDKICIIYEIFIICEIDNSLFNHNN